MFLVAMLADGCVVVLLPPFLSFLLLLVVRLAAWFFLVVFNEGHHLLYCVGGAFDECFHLLHVFFGECGNQFFRRFGLLFDHVGFEVLRSEFILLVFLCVLC